MKFFFLICLIFLLSNSCKKDKDLGSLYDSFIGKWECVNHDCDAYLELTNSGYFSYSSAIDRNDFFKVINVENINPISTNNSNWKGLVVNGKKTESYKAIYYNETMDTILVYDDLINDSTGNFNLTTVTKLYFTLK